jgi:uncharacterized protein
LITFTWSDGRLRPIWAFVLSALLSCGAFVVVGFLAAIVAGDHVLRFEAIFRPLLAALLLTVFSWLLTVGNHVESHRIAAQGLPLLPGCGRQFAIGCGLGCALVLLAVLPVAVWGHLSFHSILNAYGLRRVLIVCMILITGSLAEELMFRGYPFQRLVEAIGPAGAIMVFAVMFGLVHLSNPGANVWGLLNTVAIGVFLSLAFLQTRALWLPWGFHFGWNATMGLLLGLPVSGLRLFNVAVRATAGGPRWLTGGSYGIEASASGALAIVAGLLILWRLCLRPLAGATPFLPPPELPPPDLSKLST